MSSGHPFCSCGHRLAHGMKGTRVIRLAQGKLAETMGLEMEELTQPSARVMRVALCPVILQKIDRVLSCAIMLEAGLRAYPCHTCCGLHTESEWVSCLRKCLECKAPIPVKRFQALVLLPPVAAASGADSKFYVLRSLVPGSMRTAHVLPPERTADRGFEMMVLAMITMNGETMREGAQLKTSNMCDSHTVTSTGQARRPARPARSSHTAHMLVSYQREYLTWFDTRALYRDRHRAMMRSMRSAALFQ